VRFAELVKSPEHVHTCRLTPLSIWNATAAGVSAEEITAALSEYAKRRWIGELLDRTTLQDDQVGEYTGERKDIRPVTVATYPIVTHRDRAAGVFVKEGGSDA
jgi:hypothetical protein